MNMKVFVEVRLWFSSALYMENFLHGPQDSVLRGRYCYVEFHPEHSLLFSDVLRSHVTSFHAFRPNSPLQNINTLRSPQPFCRIPTSAPHSSYQSWTHYARAIAQPSQNLSGSHGTASEVSQIHLGAFTISIIHQH